MNARNASFGVYSPTHGLHYLVDECEDGTVGVHCVGSAGWREVARIATCGGFPCHISLSRDETRLAVANYATGSVSLIALDRDGIPIAPPQMFTANGSGPDRQRQTGPHAHWVGFSADDRWLYAVDLGTDEVRAFAVGPTNAEPAGIAYQAPPGSGPRHLILHSDLPGTAYLLSELANTVTVLSGGNGRFEATRCMSTLPDDFEGSSIAAHLAINRAGDRLYVSNRGHDSIAVFSLDKTGMPRSLQHAPTGAAYPRAFVFTPGDDQLVIAHEKDECVTVLPVGSDGLLGQNVARVAVPGAAFVFLASPEDDANDIGASPFTDRAIHR